MVSRKSHPKSRNGCLQCKQRRIKCDEVAPRCNNCTKHSIECEFTLDPSKRTTNAPRAARTRKSVSSRSDVKSERSPSSTSTPNLGHADSDETSIDLAPLHMEDLELLHHFTTQTCFTLSDRSESHILWQLTVPQEAFKHDFLMRGILAISALHKSIEGGEKKDYWAKLAVQQQDAALNEFRPLMTNPNMDQSKCDAFFALSSLIVVYGFEFPKSKESLGLFDSKNEQSEDWLPLIRGVNSIIQSLWPYIKTGKLSGLLHDHPRVAQQKQMPAILEEQLDNLERLCDTVAGGEEDVQVYKAAVSMLRDCLMRMNNKQDYECEVSIAFLWPVMIPPEFIPKVHARETEAMIILAHYCVILHQLDNYWWMRGWAAHIVRNIHGQLDDSKRVWLEWPANVIGLDVQYLTDNRLQNQIQGTRVRSDLDTTVDQSLAIPNDEIKDLEASLNGKSSDK